MSELHLNMATDAVISLLILMGYIHIAAFFCYHDWVKLGLPKSKAYWMACKLMYKFMAACIAGLVVVVLALYTANRLTDTRALIFGILEKVFG